MILYSRGKNLLQEKRPNNKKKIMYQFETLKLCDSRTPKSYLFICRFIRQDNILTGTEPTKVDGITHTQTHVPETLSVRNSPSDNISFNTRYNCYCYYQALEKQIEW